MGLTLRAGAVGVVLSVAGAWVLRLAVVRGLAPVTFDGVATSSGVGLLHDPTAQVVVLAVLLAVPLIAVASVVERRSATVTPDDGRQRAGRRPTDLYWKGAIRQYGVVWPATYGTDPGTGERTPFPHVREPYCPHCHTRVAPHTLSRWLVLRRYVWRCPSCERTYDRPSVRPEERQAVRERCDTELWAALAGDGEAYLDDLEDFHTMEWDPPADRPDGL